MMYSIQISEQAENDLRGIFEYISFVLLSPQTAAHQLRKIEAAISRLDYMPERYGKYEKEPWLSRGLRQMPVTNYIVFYLVNDERMQVQVLRILYKRRDAESQLAFTYPFKQETDIMLHEDIKEYTIK